MRRTVKKFSFQLTEAHKERLLYWAQQFQEVVWLDSNQYPHHPHTFQAILAVDAATALKTDSMGAFDKLDQYQRTANDWLFGYLTYDLKNDVENLSSDNVDGLSFPDLYFFQPKRLFLFSENQVELHYLSSVADEMDKDWDEIKTMAISKAHRKTDRPLTIRARTTEMAYHQKVERMLSHIERGDIYEANLCQEFYAQPAQLDPVAVFLRLNEISEPPFACFLKLEHYFALSASPERYLQKQGSWLRSQPIKGTARRDKDAARDSEVLQALEADPKERSENIMIADLVRNDLSRIAKKGSVTVEELCKGYTFRQVHQLISTVSCQLRDDVAPIAAIQETFPMGSMTGAPKVSAMKIIEALEDAKRGLYSGAIGYVTANGDFDFSVVIRSILYNAEKRYVSFSVGGAITAASSPVREYEECLVKAAALQKVLQEM